jgi:dTDP-4-dehydrorhamnose reductase
MVNAAALSRVADCAADPVLAERVNAELAERVAQLAAARGIRLVHVSTDLVFGAVAAGPAGLAEDAPVAPLSVYGRTKAEGERRVLAVNPAALVVRLPLLFGDSRGRGLGASDALLAAVADGERPGLFVDEFRTPLDVGDAARAIVELADGKERGVLHVAGPERLSRYELGLAVLVARGFAKTEAERAVRAASRSEFGGPERRAGDAGDVERAVTESRGAQDDKTHGAEGSEATRRSAGVALGRAEGGGDAGLEARPGDVSLDGRRARAILATDLRAPRVALADRRA